MGLNWTRTGFLRIAQRMGAVIIGDLEEPGAEADTEPVGELDVASGSLEATVVEPGEVPLAIDELTLVALMGAFAVGETVVKGAGELRFKESDRIGAVVEGLRGLGADIEETADGFTVRGDGSPLAGGTIESHGDHRLAMLGAVAGLASTGGVEVVGMDASAVSYPGFEEDLALVAGLIRIPLRWRFASASPPACWARRSASTGATSAIRFSPRSSRATFATSHSVPRSRSGWGSRARRSGSPA